MSGLLVDDLALAGMHSFAEMALAEGADPEVLAASMLHEAVALLRATRGPLRRHEVAQILRQLAFVVEKGEPVAGRA